MKIRDVLFHTTPTFSFEFFPPRTRRAAEQLYATIADLDALKPSFVSVTYGAGGSRRNLTRELVQRIQRDTDLTVVSHLTCVSASRDEIASIVDDFVDAGVENFMALRGDPPKDQPAWRPHAKGFRFASELVEFLRERHPAVGIGVAGFPDGHPATPNRLRELDHLKRKVDAGADYVCTQMFFDNRDFYDFVERCRIIGIDVPIVAGIMPITSLATMERMAGLAEGVRFPAPLLRSLARTETDAQAASVGIHWATEQVRGLIDRGVAGVHFYTLNRSGATRRIYESLGASSSEQLTVPGPPTDQLLR